MIWNEQGHEVARLASFIESDSRESDEVILRLAPHLLRVAALAARYRCDNDVSLDDPEVAGLVGELWGEEMGEANEQLADAICAVLGGAQ